MSRWYRPSIIIGVTSFAYGCNSRTDDGKFLFIKGKNFYLKIFKPGEKLPSVYADIRGKSVMDWIEEHTAGATFCTKSDLVAVDGAWSEWSPWSGCGTCGGGTQSRTRLCNSPSPSNGGEDCQGEGFDILECNTEPCKIIIFMILSG